MSHPRPRLGRPSLRPFTVLAASVALACLWSCSTGSARASDSATATAAAASSSTGLDLLLTDGNAVAAVRERYRAGDPDLAATVDLLVARAEKALELPMRSVTEKQNAPPSGDKRDYVSLSPYWWPNPDTPDGTPYVRRDGEVNPERYDYDVQKLGDVGNAIRWLGFAYYYTGDERYAEQAVQRIRHFFLDEDTRMHPRMRYGQFVPGVASGRPVGIIETLRLRWAPDAITMLSESDAMTADDLAGIKQWFGDYADWIRTSEMGQEELAAKNNHGTWGAAQVSLFSAFAGNHDAISEVVELRMPFYDKQIEADGKQPHELARTRAMDYTDFNLRGYSDLALLADRVGIDLWHRENANGATLETALNFALPYFTGQKEWPYKQITPPKYDTYAQTLRRAAVAYDEPAFEAAIEQMPLTDEGEIYMHLIMPRPDAASAE